MPVRLITSMWTTGRRLAGTPHAREFMMTAPGLLFASGMAAGHGIWLLGALGSPRDTALLLPYPVDGRENGESGDNVSQLISIIVLPISREILLADVWLH